MTRKIVKTILGSDMTDGQFRDLSLAEPDEALPECDSTPVEIEAIKDGRTGRGSDTLCPSQTWVRRGYVQQERSLDISPFALA